MRETHLVQIAVITLAFIFNVHRNIEVDDIAVFDGPAVRNAVTDDLEK